MLARCPRAENVMHLFLVASASPAVPGLSTNPCNFGRPGVTPEDMQSTCVTNLETGERWNKGSFPPPEEKE